MLIYIMTRRQLWTDKINLNRLKFTGHILRLPEGTPSREVKNALKPVTRLRGQHGYKQLTLCSNQMI